MPRPPKWTRTLKPFKDSYVRMLHEVYDRVDGMSEAQFKELQSSVDGPTDTNCGWTLYAVVPLVKEAIKHRIFKATEQGARTP